jgi:Tfp pilus assembly protein PilO
MRLPERQQLIIFGVVFLIVAGFLVLQYYPTLKRIKVLKMEKQQQSLLNSKIITDLGNVKNIAEQAEELKHKIGDYDLKVPAGPDLGRFLQQVAEIMNEQNLQEQLIQPGIEGREGQLVCMPIEIKCKGSLNQIFNFFRSLEKMERIIRIEKVSIRNEAGFSGIITLNARANIFYRPERS